MLPKSLPKVGVYPIEPKVTVCSYCKGVFLTTDGERKKIGDFQDMYNKLEIAGWKACDRCKL